MWPPGCHHGTSEPQGQQISSILLATCSLVQQKVMQGPCKGSEGEWQPGGGRGAAPRLLLVTPTLWPLHRSKGSIVQRSSLILQTGILSSEIAPDRTDSESSPGNTTQSSGLRLRAPPAGPSSFFLSLAFWSLGLRLLWTLCGAVERPEEPSGIGPSDPLWLLIRHVAGWDCRVLLCCTHCLCFPLQLVELHQISRGIFLAVFISDLGSRREGADESQHSLPPPSKACSLTKDQKWKKSHSRPLLCRY